MTICPELCKRAKAQWEAAVLEIYRERRPARPIISYINHPLVPKGVRYELWGDTQVRGL